MTVPPSSECATRGGIQDLPRPHTIPGWAALTIPIGIFLLTFAAFAPALSNGFVDFDDTVILIQNMRFRGLEPENLRWMFTTTLMGHYQPLTWLSYAIDYQLSGPELDPFAFHFTNILLHSVSAVLFYFASRRLLNAAGFGGGGSSSRQSWVVAAAALTATFFWSVHPLRVESVAWATERRDVLSGLFWLAALLAYLIAFPRAAQRPASAKWFAVSILFLLLSLLSKAWGMTFFVVVTILDWYPLRRLPENPLRWLSRDAWPVLIQKTPYVFLGLVFAATAAYAQGSVQATREAAEWPLWARLVQSAYGLVWYPRTTLWPVNLSALYELPIGLSPWEPRFIACYAVLILAAAVLLVFWRRWPSLPAAAAVFAVLVGPVLGFLQSGDQFVADRYSYLSCMSWSLLLAAGFVWLVLKVPRPVQIAAIVVVPILLALGVTTWRLGHVWESSETLWRHAASGGPDRVIPRVNYGINLQVRADRLEREGKAAEAATVLDEAIRYYQEAAQLRPIDGRPWYPLGNALKKKGDQAGAEHAFRQAAKYMTQSYMPLVNLATMLEADPARRDEALQLFREAVDSVEHPRPGSKPAGTPYLALGLALKNRGDIPGAIAAFQRAREIAIQTGDTGCREQAEGRLAQLNAGR